jgi:hypothetical protein
VTVSVIGKSDGPVRPIGGFFGLAIDDVPPVAGSVWESWVEPSGAAAAFGTGRAALAALVAATAPRRIWLPAYYCPDVTRTVAISAAMVAAKIRTYGLTDELDPDPEDLDADLAAGDLAVVVDYYGWPPSRGFRDWAQRRSDVVWVEDRAQALWTADPPWAPWCIYSARKLLGVPNGGLLVGGALPSAETAAAPDLTVALPELMRFEDRAEAQNERWYAAYRQRENGFDRDPGPMSRLTEALLRRIPIAPLVANRQANYRYLLDRLRGVAAWPRAEADVAPFGLAIAVEDAASLARRLAEERLFCARHWAGIGADPARFPDEHRWSRQLLTLPCDHRYAPEQLARLADALDRLAPNPGCIRRNRS